MTTRARSFCASRRRGFSLIELLLAMSMSAMLALSLYIALSTAIKARRTAMNAIEPTRAITIAGSMIGEDFQNVPPPTGLLAGPFIGVHQAGLGGGDNDTVQFYTVGTDGSTDTSPLADGVRRIELAVRTDVNPPVLVRRVTRNLLASTEPVPTEEVLCTGVRSFSLRYFDGVSWQTDWDSTQLGDVLPFAVQFTLELDDPSNPQGSASGNNTATPRTITRIISLPCAKLATGGE